MLQPVIRLSLVFSKTAAVDGGQLSLFSLIAEKVQGGYCVKVQDPCLAPFRPLMNDIFNATGNFLKQKMDHLINSINSFSFNIPNSFSLPFPFPEFDIKKFNLFEFFLNINNPFKGFSPFDGLRECLIAFHNYREILFPSLIFFFFFFTLSLPSKIIIIFLSNSFSKVLIF